ncbi:AAA family ATPase [Jiella avicenniae]|uniref:AAA family ATPase n=1 Tax=Jiella avicenniae TaxID=2907202 RepID=A0A9X1T2Y0_9HYPH|nr:AAA family ATPase [Jiella avicenniae]MCE7026771.1 AAA family ATPase [Jiella avicenniae]
MAKFVVLSGCSGGGKTTLLDELAGRGHRVVEEPGRRIVAEERRGDGSALPWVDLAAFARRAVALARSDCEAASAFDGIAFFDRGLIYAAAALEHATGETCLTEIAAGASFHRRVFMTPPWPEIFARDDDRRHGLPEAVAEYERLLAAYSGLGYRIDVLPKTTVRDRADHVLRALQRDFLLAADATADAGRPVTPHR